MNRPPHAETALLNLFHLLTSADRAAMTAVNHVLAAAPPYQLEPPPGLPLMPTCYKRQPTPSVAKRSIHRYLSRPFIPSEIGPSRTISPYQLD
jgi:hypothetical protein